MLLIFNPLSSTMKHEVKLWECSAYDVQLMNLYQVLSSITAENRG